MEPFDIAHNAVHLSGAVEWQLVPVWTTVHIVERMNVYRGALGKIFNSAELTDAPLLETVYSACRWLLSWRMGLASQDTSALHRCSDEVLFRNRSYWHWLPNWSSSIFTSGSIVPAASTPIGKWGGCSVRDRLEPGGHHTWASSALAGRPSGNTVCDTLPLHYH